jgi:putative peptidoglycan lipid II flippase
VYQVNSVVITLLATTLSQGSVSYLYYADRLIQLPLGVFGIATATAVLPALSRQAAGKQWDALRQTFAHAMSLIFFITLPAMAGLMVLRGPIIELLFQRGAFDAQATRLTADALLYYGVGLWSFAAVRVILNLFFALQDTRTPLRVAVICVTANLIFGLALMGPMGHSGLALGLALASMVQLVLLVGILRYKMGAFGWRAMAFTIARSALCAALMGGAVWAVSLVVLPSANSDGIPLLAGVVCCILLGVAVFVGLAYVTGAPELKEVKTMVLNRSSKR